MKCEHKNLRKNYPFGRKSKPTMKCKDCGEIVKPKDLEKLRIDKLRGMRKR